LSKLKTDKGTLKLGQHKEYDCQSSKQTKEH
jgi:hypothetical protein